VKRYITAHAARWKSAKHASAWENTLASYCYSTFGSTRVNDVDTALVLKALQPIWTSRRVTAMRVRSKIERVLDWAKERGFRDKENSARWRGHLETVFDEATVRVAAKRSAAGASPVSPNRESHKQIRTTGVPTFTHARRGDRPIELTAHHLKRWRLSMGLSQLEFWAIFGVTQSAGARYEAGHRLPRSIQQLISIASERASSESGRSASQLKNAAWCAIHRHP
jgi:hypothetical protein